MKLLEMKVTVIKKHTLDQINYKLDIAEENVSKLGQ